MDLLANYNDDSLNLEDSPSVNEKEVNGFTISDLRKKNSSR